MQQLFHVQTATDLPTEQSPPTGTASPSLIPEPQGESPQAPHVDRMFEFERPNFLADHASFLRCPDYH